MRQRHPFLDVEGPIGFAHRGGAEEAPENTLEAFAAAQRLGYVYMETDVHLTADGVVMAFHDPRLDRVTDAAGAIADLPVAVVEAADAGYAHTSADGDHRWRGRGVRVPRLETLLEALPGCRFNIDCKDDRTALPLMRLLIHQGVLDRVCVAAFSDSRLRRMRHLGGPRLCTSMGPREVARLRLEAWSRLPHRGAAGCVQIPVRQSRVTLVERRLIATAHAAGLPVHVWTVDDRTEMDRLLDLGVDGIMTDRPSLLRDALASRGRHVDGLAAHA